MTDTPIGFNGIGTLGKPMSINNIRKAALPLAAADPDETATAILAQQGAEVAANARAVADQACKETVAWRAALAFLKLVRMKILRNVPWFNRLQKKYEKDQVDQSETAEAEMVHPRSRFCQYIGNNTVLTETYFGRKIYLDSTDISLSPHIMVEGRWENWVSDYFCATIRPGDCFIDVGANCGFFSLLAAHLTGPDGLVLAVEPQLRLADLLRRSAAVNGFTPTLRVETVAVSDQAGAAVLGHVGDYLGSSSLLAGFGDGSRPGSEVTTATLDSLASPIMERLAADPNTTLHIKIDVEGFEPKVWGGMGRLLERAPKLNLLIEFSAGRYKDLGVDPKDFLLRIRECGLQTMTLSHTGDLADFGPDDVDRLLELGDGAFVDLIACRGLDPI